MSIFERETWRGREIDRKQKSTQINFNWLIQTRRVLSERLLLAFSEAYKEILLPKLLNLGEEHLRVVKRKDLEVLPLLQLLYLLPFHSLSQWLIVFLFERERLLALTLHCRR
jgi:hypothetical protein